jgi:hypothetical protein
LKIEPKKQVFLQVRPLVLQVCIPEKITSISKFACKTNPELINQKAFEFTTQSLTAGAPRVKWEAAKFIRNTAHLFSKLLKKGVVKLSSSFQP